MMSKTQIALWLRFSSRMLSGTRFCGLRTFLDPFIGGGAKQIIPSDFYTGIPHWAAAVYGGYVSSVHVA